MSNSELCLDFECSVEGLKRLNFYGRVESYYPILVVRVAKILKSLLVKNYYWIPQEKLFPGFAFGCFDANFVQFYFSKCTLKIKNNSFSIVENYDESIGECISVDDLIIFLTKKIKFLLMTKYNDDQFKDYDYFCKFTINLFGYISEIFNAIEINSDDEF